MRRSKKLLILVAVLVAACVATFALSRHEEKQEQIKNSNAVILEISQDSVTGLSWRYDSGDGFAFTRAENGWEYDEDTDFPVSEEKIRKILEHFECYGVTFVIENVEDYSQYGLDEPECTLHLTTETADYDLKMGDFSKMDEQRYIDIGDGNVYLVAEDPLDYVESSLSAMIQHDDTPTFSTAVKVTFTGMENSTITREEESTNTYNSDADIYFTVRNGQTVPLDTEKVKTYLNTFKSLDLSTYVTYHATEEELQRYGLDEPMLSVTIDYEYTDEEGQTQIGTSVLHLSEDPEERAASDQAVAEGENATAVTKYARVGDSQIVYSIADTSFATLTGVGYDDLRHKEVFWADFETVTAIDVTLEDTNHTLTWRLTDAEDEDAGYAWFYGDAEVNLDAFQSALEGLCAECFTEEQPDKAEELALTIHLNNESFPTVELQLYRYDGTQCLAVVDGMPVSLVPRASVMELVETVQAIVLN